MQQQKLKNRLTNMFTGDVLMEWEIYRYPVDPKDPAGKTMVEFAGNILDEDFGKDTFGFYSTDEKNFVWMFDVEQRLSTRAGEEDREYENIEGGPTVMELESVSEAAEYMVYIMEALNAASFKYSEKGSQMEAKKGEG